MAEPASALQLLTPEGALNTEDASAAEYLPLVEELGDDLLKAFYRDMVLIRRFDVEAANLQRQGEMGLWVPSMGQEAAQVGSGHAARPQDHIFPAYREHSIGMIRGLDVLDIIRMLRGVTHGGWDPAETGNFHLYTLVIGSQTLHATGYAQGIALDGLSGTGDPDVDQAVIVYFGDGATSQGDVSEALTFAASWQTPQVFFLENNHWAISVPVTTQSRTSLYLRGGGFGVPSIQVDGNDVLASYLVSRRMLDEARSGKGPQLIEALTYRIGAHTSSDDPTKYRAAEELADWGARDPITRYETWLRNRGEGEAFFSDVAADAEDFAADIRRRTLALAPPPAESMFAHVYAEQHPEMDAQRAWLADYETSLEAGA
ncbi:MAG TPA: thiamine pyrophosphate-dependent dehydrogenase E1 component subunit alpha [Terrimesophilobacter sp.]|nr:thiamine pyrophosphate-dependent dehydrogenase E1 component subunit alpha [Terrimesophilobacter sp.]